MRTNKLGMKRFPILVFCCSCAFLTFPETPVYEEVPPLQRLDHIRVRGPRRVTEDEARFLVELPRRTYPIETLEEEEQTEVTAHLRIRHLSADLEISKDVTLRFLPTGQITGGMGNSMEVDLADWPDGEAEARFVLPGLPEESDIPAPPLAFRIVREAVAAIAEEHRPEMDAWIEDANRLTTIWGKRPLWPALDHALAQTESPWEGLRGFLLRAYFNPQLERMQPYTLYVPEALDLSEPAPLMILLHGSGGDYRNLVADYAAGQRFEEHPMLIANAGAFPNLEFRHLALNNVRWIIEDVSNKYGVDRDRIYVQGISLGGRGTLDLAALLPDVFAAVSSQGTYGIHRTLMDPLHAVHADPVAYQLAARNDIRTWMPNLATTPVEMVFGWSDTSTRPVGALAIASVLETLRYRVVERGFDLGHNLTLPDYDWASTREWFLNHRKERWPRQLQFRVANLRHNRFAWIRVDALHDYTGVGEVKARILADNTLALETRNVARLTYLPPPMMHEIAETFPDGMRVFHFDRENRPLETSPDAMEGPQKHPGQSGPLWNFFSDPILIVWDDSDEDENTRSRLQMWAANASRSGATPGPVNFPVKAASEVTPEDRRERNLYFITFPESEHTWREAIPLALPEKAEEVRTAAAEEGRATSLFALRPSPWADNRLVIVAEGVGHLPSIDHIHYFQEHLQPDWVILQGRTPIAAGSYNHDWSPGPMTTENFITRLLTR
ncbi:MAG: hypothetical protein LAT83_05575 [Kiritimatiellae bacterium]|nr:hypothetical protein [Kiritimatiellia bacterium]